MKRETHYIILKNGKKKYFDFTLGGYLEAMKYVHDNIEECIVDEKGNYTIYYEEIGVE